MPRLSQEARGRTQGGRRIPGKGGRHRGREDLDQPFRDRRPPKPGDPIAEAFARTRTVREAAKVAVAVFGVPRRTVAFILRLDLSNAIKMMRLVKQSRFWSAYWDERLPKRSGRAGPGRTQAGDWEAR